MAPAPVALDPDHGVRWLVESPSGIPTLSGVADLALMAWLEMAPS